MLPGALVIIAAIYLVGLGFASFAASERTSRFLLAFASSAGAHYTEMLIRLVIGVSFVIYAPRMLFAHAFVWFGWILVVSALALMMIPWRWHRRFARRAVPPLTRRPWLLGLPSFVLGAAILLAAWHGDPFWR